MDPIVLMTSKWGATFHISWYLFLGGMSGGILIVAAVAELLAGHKPRYQALSGLSALLGLPFMVVGGLTLALHLGKPERGIFFPLFMTNTDSWMLTGAWIVGAFVPVCVAVAAAWYFEVPRIWRVILAIISIPLGALLCLYTGFLLSAVRFVPLWAREFLPILFLLSGLSTGLAVCAINAYVVRLLPFPERARVRIQGAGLEKTAPVLGALVVVVLIVEFIWTNNFLNTLARGTVGGRVAAAALREGPLFPWFVWGVEVVGIFLPIALSILEPILRLIYKRSEGWAVGWPLFAKLHLVLLGGLILRHVIVWGGEMKQPLLFPPQKAEIPRVGTQGSAQALSQALREIHRR